MVDLKEARSTRTFQLDNKCRNMSAEYPGKYVSPLKCNEKPWDSWVSEIGHSSPKPDDEEIFVSPAAIDVKGEASRRLSDTHPYKSTKSQLQYRRAGINRLKNDTMALHGLFPQMDNMNAAVCHMCGVTVKCSAAYRHLLDSHASFEPVLPPPPVPTVKLKSSHSRSRHKKELAPPLGTDIIPVKIETSPVHTATAPLSRIIVPQPDMQYLDEPSTSSGITGEVQVCVESGELPVVSIQDTEDLHLGEHLTDDIFAIMNSEGIQSADDITNTADWKNIIRDLGNMQDLNFMPSIDSVQTQDLFTPIEPSIKSYTMQEPDLTNIQFSNTPSLSSTKVEKSKVYTQPPKSTQPTTPSSKSQSRSKPSKKFLLREYDPNKHCGVVTADNPKPCTRSLTCKSHALSLRRMVEGRIKPFDTLLAEHRASKDPANIALAAAPPPPAPVANPPLLVNTASIDLGTFNTLTDEQHVNDIYASLLSVEDPSVILQDSNSLTSLLSQPLPADLLLPDDAEVVNEPPILSIASPEQMMTEDKHDETPPVLLPSEVCWYTTCPRPLAVCTFNAAHAGGAITLGKKFATVRSNIKSSLSRSQKNLASSSGYYFGQSSMSLSKTVHLNSGSKASKPEVRRLVVVGGVDRTIGAERFAANGHLPRRSLKTKRPSSTLMDLGLVLDPLLDDKC